MNICKSNIECCGCGTCALVCPVSIITMRADDEGFLYPSIDSPDKCINCHKCESICPELNRVVQPRSTSGYYAGFSSDNNEIKICASGGFASVLSRRFIENGGVVYGVKYSADYKEIEYGRASKVTEIEDFRGSKYSQSFKKDTFVEIKKDLKQGLSVLFIGLPCDVAALNNYTKNINDNLYTVELVCHGVTSPLVHREFIDGLEKENNARICDFSVRYKIDAWKPYYIHACYTNGKEQIFPFRPTEYGIAFHYFKRPSCNDCKFKIYDDSFGLQADLTIGDNHGVEKDAPSYNHWGSSVVLLHTEKGRYMLSLLGDSFNLTANTDVVVKRNLALRKPFPKRKERNIYKKTLLAKGLKATKSILPIVFRDKKIALRRKIGEMHVWLLNLKNKNKR